MEICYFSLMIYSFTITGVEFGVILMKIFMLNSLMQFT